MTTYTESNKLSGEYWMAVPGYRDSYEVSTSGRVRSIDRINVNRLGVRRFLRGVLLSAATDGEGYPQVALLRCGVESKRRVHRIVAETYVKNKHGLPLVDHVNRDRTDCRVSNLRWTSYSGNRANSAQTVADIERMATEEAAAASKEQR